jgi:hypothetical protein
VTIQVFPLENLERHAPVKDYYELEAVERDVDMGAWKITLPLGQRASTAYSWINLVKPGIEIVDLDAGFTFGGYATRYKVDYSRERNTVTIEGKDFQSKLQNRLSWPDPQNLSDWWRVVERTMPLTTAAHWVVNNNCGYTCLPQRRIPDLVMMPDPELGPSKTFISDGDPVLEVIREWLVDTPYTARLKLERKETVAASTVAVTFTVDTRPYSSTVLHYGALDQWSVEEVASSTTWTLAQGGTWKEEVEAERVRQGLGPDDPDPPVRYMTESADSLVNTNWRREYIEEFVNRPSSTFADLTEKTTEYSKSKKPTLNVVVEDLNVGHYGKDLEIGWLVPFTPLAALDPTPGAPFPDWGYLPVSEFKLKMTPDETQKVVTLGRKTGGPGDGLFTPIREALSRAKRIERLLPRTL